MLASRHWAGPFLAVLVLLPAAIAEPPAPAAPPAPAVPPAPGAPAPAAPAAPELAAPSPYRLLFPFGVRNARANAEGMPAARIEAIESALAWLAAHATASGAWDPANLAWCNGKQGTTAPDGVGKHWYAGGMTGLSVYTLLAAGHLPEPSDRHGKVLAAAFAWLRTSQDAQGCVGGRDSPHHIYNHAFGALALVEGFAATGDPALFESARRALAFSESVRNPHKAWRYNIAERDSDTSVTGCMSLPFCAALRINEQAAAAGLVEPFAADDLIFEGVRAWLDEMTDESGRVGYQNRGQGPARTNEKQASHPPELSEAITAIGLALRLLLPGGDPVRDGNANEKAVALLRNLPPKWEEPRGSTDFYYWYYGALAMYANGGDGWKEWDLALSKALLLRQRSDGDVCGARGSWDPIDPWADDGGRMYSTCMATLCLLTPWRLPRLPAQRSDLVAATQAKDAPAEQVARWLDGAALFRVPGAEKAALPLAKSPDPLVRAAAVRAAARTDAGPGGAQAVVTLLSDPDPVVRRAAAEAARWLEGRAGPAVRALVAALADADPEVRAHAANALGAAGATAATAVGDLRARLTDTEPRARVAAAGALVRLAPDPAAQGPVLVAGLKAPAPTVRAEAAQHLGRLGDATLATPLEALLADPSGPVRLAAAEALVALRKPSEAVVKVLGAALADADLETRRSALRVLVTLGPAAAPAARALGETALGGPRALRIVALQALGAIGAPAAEALPAVYYCRDASRGPVGQAAEEALSHLIVPPETAVAVLARALETTDERLVHGAIAGLVVQGPGALQPLMTIVRDAKRTAASRVRALQALARMGTIAEPAVWPLERVLDEDPDAGVRREAATVLGAIGPRAAAATPTLIKHLDDKAVSVQMAVVHALARVGTPAAVEAIGAVAKRKTKEPDNLRIEAIRALGEVGAAADPLYDTLLLLRADELSSVWKAADQAIGQLGALFVERLRTALKGTQILPRRGAVLALATIGAEAKAAVPELVALFEDPANGLTDLVGRSLAAMGKPAVKFLTKNLKHDNLNVRAASVKALGDIGKDATPAIPALKQVARSDRDVALQMAAEQAVEKIKAAK